MYLTGSRLLNHQLGWSVKPESDWDIVLEGEEVESFKGVDISPDGLLSQEICEQYQTSGLIETPIGPAKLVDPICMMLFKRSHLHRTIKFAKHIREYHELKKLYPNPDSRYQYFLEERTKLTKKKYGDKTPSLKKSKDEFFDDYVVKKYVHDDIHRATCYGERPVYEELQNVDGLVWCSKDLWNGLPHYKKVYCVREECFVIGLERFMIPFIEEGKKCMPERMAFANALERICTTLTGGFFRDFAIDNWPEIIDCDYDFVGKFISKGYELG